MVSISQLSDQVYGLIAQQLFPSNELFVLLSLFDAYPHYARYSDLISALSDRTLTNMEGIVQQAVENQELDVLLAPLRNTLKRCRRRLLVFGLDIYSLRGLGYSLYRKREA